MEKKEAMKILKDFYDKSALFSIRTALDTVIPELKESEDEKIRKAIYNCVEWFGFDSCFLKDVSQEECLAWIKTQVETFTKKDIDDAYLKGICDAKHELEKQGGQKPWSEDDVNMFGSILSTLSMYSNNPDIPAEVREIHKKEYAWFDELYNRTFQQPKQEWKTSDGQMETLEYYMHVLVGNIHKEILFSLYQDLKKL